MDQVKVVLGYLQKYHFWVLCLIVIVAGFVGWMKASGGLSKEFQMYKGDVEGKFQALDSVLNGDPPPNDNWTQALSALTKQEQEKVAAAWKSVYEDQQKVLHWPVDVMGDKFAQWVADAKPGAEIPPVDRAFYQNNVINKEFPRLLEIVEAAPPDVADRRPTDGNQGPEPELAKYKVVWESGSQAAVKSALTMSGAVPTSQAVWLRQEDLWVFKALLNIIRNTNEGTTFSSRVKIIEKLAIGKEAAELSAEGMSGEHIQHLGDGAAPTPGMLPPPEVPVGPGTEPPPDENRYVGEDGKPLPTTPVGEQYKRMPVYLKLVMDQREITRLLTECANYPLPVEVRQLRINPNQQQGGKGSQRQSAETTARARAGGPPAAARDVYDVTVEIHGIIYIYNPPDMEKLGEPPEGGGAQLAGY